MVLTAFTSSVSFFSHLSYVLVLYIFATCTYYSCISQALVHTHTNTVEDKVGVLKLELIAIHDPNSDPELEPDPNKECIFLQCIYPPQCEACLQASNNITHVVFTISNIINTHTHTCTHMHTCTYMHIQGKVDSYLMIVKFQGTYICLRV